MAIWHCIYCYSMVQCACADGRYKHTVWEGIYVCIVYSGPRNRYASAVVSKRNGKNTSISYTYLGKVIDNEAGIYQSKERGLYMFDPATGKYGSVPDSYVPPEEKKSNRHVRISVDYADVCFYGVFSLWACG